MAVITECSEGDNDDDDQDDDDDGVVKERLDNSYNTVFKYFACFYFYSAFFFSQKQILFFFIPLHFIPLTILATSDFSEYNFASCPANIAKMC